MWWWRVMFIVLMMKLLHKSQVQWKMGRIFRHRNYLIFYTHFETDMKTKSEIGPLNCFSSVDVCCFQIKCVNIWEIY